MKKTYYEKDLQNLLKTHLKTQLTEQEQEEYKRALRWRVLFAERGFKLSNKFIPENWINKSREE